MKRFPPFGLIFWFRLLFSLLAVGFILFIISRKLAGPLQQMNRAALELAHGDFTTRVPVTSQDEVGQLATSFNFMVDSWRNGRERGRNF